MILMKIFLNKELFHLLITLLSKKHKTLISFISYKKSHNRKTLVFIIKLNN
jgi:hypothetical protein